MTNSENLIKYIHHCLVERDNMSMRDLAKGMETTPQNLNGMFINNNFKVSTLEKIANVLNADLDVKFIDRNTGKPIDFN